MTPAKLPKGNPASISLLEVSKSYGRTEIIPPLSADIKAGEFIVVLGPSGCGKSTLLMMIAGLETVSGGRITFGDREVQSLEPRARGCAMVFQNYALYPHMTIADNIGYSLKVAGLGRGDRQRRVAEVAQMLGLSNHLTKRPSQLSGGQRQRVAIGRAIVREPSVLLFDEPLSNLDAQLRHDMRIELAALHKRIGATSVFVTHDQVEAMTLADRILILNKGHVEQFGTPHEVYHSPASTFVAGFLGSPPMNILPVIGDGTALRLPDGQVVAHAAAKGSYSLGIRPEDIQVAGVGSGPIVHGAIEYREDLGSHIVLALRAGDAVLRVSVPHTTAVAAPDLTLTLPVDKLHLFDPKTGRAVTGAVGLGGNKK